MPKRKRHHKDYDEIRRKIKKLERDLYRARDTRSVDSRDSSRDDPVRYYEYPAHSDTNSIRYDSEHSLDSLDGDIYGDCPDYLPLEDSAEIMDPDAPAYTVEGKAAPVASAATAPIASAATAPIASATTARVASAVVASTAPAVAALVGPNDTRAHAAVTAPATSTAHAVTTVNQTTDSTKDASEKESVEALDSSILEILGVDPSDSIEYGKEIRQELASRLEHIATTGLSKEVRKELLEKYLVPANCTKIGAPLMNAEIKAAVTEVITKRDKGIEVRQKQLACAISGLAGLINRELESTVKDNDRLKQLMDIGRILCDVQHSESVTRRNFAIFSIKKDLKDHVANAKIDKYLFGEGLAETLKTAKAVSKSGTDLKIKSQVRTVKPYASTSNNLNWRAPAPARRQQGPQRNREPAHSATTGPSTRPSRASRHGNSSKTSQPPQRPRQRR